MFEIKKERNGIYSVEVSGVHAFISTVIFALICMIIGAFLM